MVLNNEILPDDIIRLLYEQQFLNPEDEDYENWNRGLITTFDLLIKKIQKLEITPADLALDHARDHQLLQILQQEKC